MSAPLEDEYCGTYWQAARAHRLEIARCQDCGWWIHYPREWCPRCHTRNVAPAAVSGRGRIASHTTTHRHPEPAPDATGPLVHVLVELEEQPGLRVAATLVAGTPTIGAAVTVVFDDGGGYTLPRFVLSG